MTMYATRLQEGQDLRQGIIDFVLHNSLPSAAIVSVVGSLSSVVIRMAGAQPDSQDIRTYEGSFEIVSLVGTIAHDGTAHIHISFSDKEGNVTGGHLKEGTVVHTTAELIIISEEKVRFSRQLDAETGFDELGVEHITH